MKRVHAGLALLLALWAACGTAAGRGLYTLVDGDARVLRKTTWYRLEAGARIEEGDVVDVSDHAQVQLEPGGAAAIGVIGPALMYLPETRADAKAPPALQLTLLRGWIKAWATAKAPSVRFDLPQIGAIARIDATTLTMTGMVMGTPTYMAPEQCRGLPSDHRADLFSTGVVLYELLTGIRPFAGSMEAVAYKICHEHPRPASELCPFPLPPAMDALIDKALAKAPDARFSDASAFETALRAACGTPAPSGETTVINLSDVHLAPSAQAFDDATLSTLERRLVRFVGPMAKIIVRQAALRAHDRRELCDLLCVHIGDPKERERFAAEANSADGSGAAHTGRQATGGSRGTTASARGTVASSGSRTRTPRPLEQAFVEQTTQRLAVYLGPIAKVVAKKAAQQAHDCDEFVQLVAEHVGTQDRHAFLREVGAEDA